MRYRRPFDWSQRSVAARSYKQFRANIKDIQLKFPPGTAVERSLLRQYRKLAQDFARELLNSDDKVNPDRLNELEQDASNKAIQYHIKRTLRELGSVD